MAAATRSGTRASRLSQPGWITLEGGFAARKCVVQDMSKTGAKITVDDPNMLPAKLRLAFARDASTGRTLRSGVASRKDCRRQVRPVAARGLPIATRYNRSRRDGLRVALVGEPRHEPDPASGGGGHHAGRDRLCFTVRAVEFFEMTPEPSRHRRRDELLESGSAGELPEPAFEMRQMWFADAFDPEPAPRIGAERNIGNGEIIAFDEAPRRQAGHRRCAIARPPRRHLSGSRSCRAVRPGFAPAPRTPGRSTGCSVESVQSSQRSTPARTFGASRIDRRSLPVGEHEVAHDRIRFPEHEIAVHQGRHPPVGIHREVVGLVIAAERHAGVDALVGEVEFAQAPQHFLHVDRIGPAPNRELSLIVVRHDVSLPMIRRSWVISEFHRKSAGRADNKIRREKSPASGGA